MLTQFSLYNIVYLVIKGGYVHFSVGIAVSVKIFFQRFAVLLVVFLTHLLNGTEQLAVSGATACLFCENVPPFAGFGVALHGIL